MTNSGQIPLTQEEPVKAIQRRNTTSFLKSLWITSGSLFPNRTGYIRTHAKAIEWSVSHSGRSRKTVGTPPCPDMCVHASPPAGPHTPLGIRDTDGNAANWSLNKLTKKRVYALKSQYHDLVQKAMSFYLNHLNPIVRKCISIYLIYI